MKRLNTPYSFTVKGHDGRLHWYLRWFALDDVGQPRQRAKSLGFSSPANCPPKARAEYKARAQVEAFRMRQQFLDGFRPDQILPTAKELDIGGAITRYAATREGRYASAGEEAATLGLWHGWMTGRPHARLSMNALAVKDVNDWITHRLKDVQPSTAAKELARIASFLAWASDEGILSKPIPLRAIRKSLAIHPQEPPPLSDEAVMGAIARQPTPLRKGLITLLACTGLRADELASLPSGAVDIGEALLRVPQGEHERTKRHGRVIPLPVGCCAFLAPLLRSAGPLAWNGDTLLDGIDRQALLRMLRGCPDPGRPGKDLTPKRLRQWACSTLTRLGCPSYLVRGVLGHVAPGNLKRYETAGLYSPQAARIYVQSLENLIAKERPCTMMTANPPPSEPSALTPPCP